MTLKQLVHFTADWCNPCKQMKPIVREFLDQNPDIEYFVVDVDDNPKVALSYEVQSVPTFISVIDEKNFKRHSGSGNKDMLLNLFTEDIVND